MYMINNFINHRIKAKNNLTKLRTKLTITIKDWVNQQ